MGGDSGAGPGGRRESASFGGAREDADESWDYDDTLDGQWPDGLSKDRDMSDGERAQVDLAGELPYLMALLGQLIDQHGPGGVVALSRSDAERRELMAYAAGWQDAAAEFAPRVAAARRDGWLGRWRPLRVLNGPGDVIPFPIARQYAHAAEPAEPAPADPSPAHHQDQGDSLLHGQDAGQDADRAGDYSRGREPGAAPGPGPDSHDGRSHEDETHGGREATAPAGDGQTAAPRPGRGRGPSFPAKSRWSRTPTIPRLTPPRQRPPGGMPPLPDAPE